jgi:hypothetical protein
VTARAASAAVLIFASVCGSSHGYDLKLQIIGRDTALGEHVDSRAAFVASGGAAYLAPNISHERGVMKSFGALERINYTPSDGEGGESAVHGERVEIFDMKICGRGVGLIREYGLRAPIHIGGRVSQTLSGGLIGAGSRTGNAYPNLDFSNSSSLWRHLKPATGVFRGTKDKLDRVGAL